MERVWQEEVYKVEIEWSNPISYDDALNVSLEKLEEVYFYKIIGEYSDSYSLMYIGKVYDQAVSERLKNKDHQVKRAQWQTEHPRTKFCISFGQLKSKHFDEETEKWKRKVVDDIESLLIYSHSDHMKLKNSKSIWSHSILLEYQVLNTGFIKEKMIEELAYGLFYKDTRF